MNIDIFIIIKVMKSKIVWFQKEINLKNKSRGCHYITDEVISAIGSQLKTIKTGTCHLFCITSC